MRHSAWSAHTLAMSHAAHGDGVVGGVPEGGGDEGGLGEVSGANAVVEAEAGAGAGAGAGADSGIPINDWAAQPLSGDSNARTGVPTTGGSLRGTTTQGTDQTQGTALSAMTAGSSRGKGTNGANSANDGMHGLGQGEGEVKVNDWYDEKEGGGPRTAQGASPSRGDELRGFYRGSTSEAAAAREARLDLVGGSDLADWLAQGAAQRAGAANEAANSRRRQAGEHVDDDFMLFD